MPIMRGIVVGLVSVATVLAIAASHAGQPTVALQAAGSQPPQAVSAAQSLEQTDGVVWARVPFCNCFAVGASATTNVSNAIKEANLAVTLKELSPSDGWLYFVANFDTASITVDQVSSAIEAGGGELLDGPP